jgi:hypothetical protein
LKCLLCWASIPHTFTHVFARGVEGEAPVERQKTKKDTLSLSYKLARRKEPRTRIAAGQSRSNASPPPPSPSASH